MSVCFKTAQWIVWWKGFAPHPRPSPRSTGARGDSGFESEWGRFRDVFCCTERRLLYSCRSVNALNANIGMRCARFQVVKKDHPPSGFCGCKFRLGRELWKGELRYGDWSEKNFGGGFANIGIWQVDSVAGSDTVSKKNFAVWHDS